MTKEQQIEILKLSKKFLRSYTRICSALTSSILKYDSYKNSVDTIQSQIPSFNKENITKLCKENGLPLPSINGLYWWNLDEEGLQIRLKVLDLLIKDLQK